MERILTLRELEEVVGLRKTAIYKAIRDDEFPSPIKLTSHRSGWLASEVQEWIKSKKEVRDGSPTL